LKRFVIQHTISPVYIEDDEEEQLLFFIRT